MALQADVLRAYAIHEFLQRLNAGEDRAAVLQEASSAGLLDAVLNAEAEAHAASRHGKHVGQLVDPAYNAAMEGAVELPQG